MDVNSVNLLNTTLGASARSAATLADSFDNFLTLLTTQLQNQDPLSPMDSNDFTTQLVQFAGVEQEIATNKNLETLIRLSFIDRLNGAVAFLGKNVVTEGDAAELSNGAATWTYTLNSDTVSTSILVFDDVGQVVFTAEGETGAGPHVFDWDGTDSDGLPLADGVFRIEVAGVTPSGGLLRIDTRISGTVTGVSSVNGEPVLRINGTDVPLSNVISVSEAASESAV